MFNLINFQQVVLVGSGLFYYLYLGMEIIVPFFHNISSPDTFAEDTFQIVFLQGGIAVQVALFMFMTYILR